MRELLIVGVDPGTTLGYAVLDTQGRILRTRASKQLELNSLLEEVVRLGSILAIGTDKKKVPGLVEKAAAAVRARVVSPREDLAVTEKDELTMGCAVSTEHEKDALAAALYAHKELEPLLERIRKVLEAENKTEYFTDVTETVVMRGRNIRDALREAVEAAEPMPAAAEKQAPQPAKIEGKDGMQSLLLRRAERENEILRNYSSKLLKMTKQLNKELQKARGAQRKARSENKSEKEKSQRQLLYKLEAIINGKEKKIAGLQEEITGLALIISHAQHGKGIAAKKLSTLGFNELKQKSQKLIIGEGDILLVENADIFSEKTLSYIQQKGVTLLTRKKPSPNVAKLLAGIGLTALAAEGLVEMECESFALVDSERLLDARKKHGGTNVLSIIESYKEERKNLI